MDDASAERTKLGDDPVSLIDGLVFRIFNGANDTVGVANVTRDVIKDGDDVLEMANYFVVGAGNGVVNEDGEFLNSFGDRRKTVLDGDDGVPDIPQAVEDELEWDREGRSDEDGKPSEGVSPKPVDRDLETSG